MKKIKLCFLLMLLNPLTSYSNQNLDGMSLFSSCVSVTTLPNGKYLEANAYDAGYCTGIIRGVSSFMGEASGTCMPNPTSGIQIAQVVVEYLQANAAESFHANDAMLVARAIQDKWACTK